MPNRNWLLIIQNCAMHILLGRIEGAWPDASTKEKCERRKAPTSGIVRPGFF
jgi:hypothetical protein